MEIKKIKAKLNELGEFNGWKGYIGLYLTQKELRTIKKAGVDYEILTMREVYDRLLSQRG